MQLSTCRVIIYSVHSPFDLSPKHAGGCSRSIAQSDNLGPGLRKEFRVPSSRPLVIALSVDARLAPAACIIKLPACRNANEAYLRGGGNSCTHTHARTRTQTFLFIPPFHLSPLHDARGHRKGHTDTLCLGVPRHARTPTRAPFVHPFRLLHPRASTQFPLTLIYLNYILRASSRRACVGDWHTSMRGSVCGSCAARVRRRDGFAFMRGRMCGRVCNCTPTLYGFSGFYVFRGILPRGGFYAVREIQGESRMRDCGRGVEMYGGAMGGDDR